MSSPPIILFQPPPGNILLNYNIRLPSTEQNPSSGVPQTYLDSQTVRENVFAKEQNAVPIKYQQDRDDTRSFCWVLYSSFPDVKPIGTIRLVPSPHHPHPAPGAKFEAPNEEPPGFGTMMLFKHMPLPEYAIDRKTSLHDGSESYVKLGRLCVVQEERGKRLADLLINAALDWAKENVQEIGKGVGDKVPRWMGLVCVHAQEKAVGVWERHGFVIDEAMGSWFEGGIRHLGMFRRLELEEE
jgi:predicted GNAT family N-acyltransferase